MGLSIVPSPSWFQLIISYPSLKQRFIRNQEDCVFTSQALVPTLGNQILEELDVEAITLELQQHGSKSKHQDLTSTVSSLDGTGQTDAGPEPTTQVEVKAKAAQTESEAPEPSASIISITDEVAPSSTLNQSWVDEFAASQIQPPDHHHGRLQATSSDGSPLGSLTGISDSVSLPGAYSEGDVMVSLSQALLVVRRPLTCKCRQTRSTVNRQAQMRQSN